MVDTKLKLIAITALVAVALLVARRVGGDADASTDTDDDDDIDTVRTAESDDAEPTDTPDLPEPAARAVDAFDYLAIAAAGGKAAYEEYQSRAG